MPIVFNEPFVLNRQLPLFLNILLVLFSDVLLKVLFGKQAFRLVHFIAISRRHTGPSHGCESLILNDRAVPRSHERDGIVQKRGFTLLEAHS